MISHVSVFAWVKVNSIRCKKVKHIQHEEVFSSIRFWCDKEFVFIQFLRWLAVTLKPMEMITFVGTKKLGTKSRFAAENSFDKEKKST